MSAIDVSFPLKYIFIFLSVSKETACCRGGDRQRELGTVLCDSIFFLVHDRVSLTSDGILDSSF